MNRSAADLILRHGHRAKVVAFDALAFDTHESFWRECRARAPAARSAASSCFTAIFPSQAEAQADVAIARQTIDVNFTSAVSLLTIIANDFESRRRGFICVFSSVAGDRGRQSNYVYGSAKSGLSAYVQGLRNRLFRHGVTVLTVKPGFVDTGMTWGLPGMFLVASPEKVARDVYRAVRRRASVIYTPFFWRFIMLIIKCMPEFVFKRMKT